MSATAPSNVNQPASRPDTKPRCDHCTTRTRCLFGQQAQPEHEQFRSLIQERSLAVGDTLETQNTFGPTLGVIKVGLLKGLRKGPGHQTHPILLMGRGRLVGFTHPFGQPAMFTTVAITPARICEVNVQAVRDFAVLHPPFQQAMYEAIADFLGVMADWSNLLRHSDFLGSVHSALRLIAREEGNQAFRIPNHVELAKLLGARRETIARHIALLIDKGLLKKADRWHAVLANDQDKGPG